MRAPRPRTSNRTFLASVALPLFSSFLSPPRPPSSSASSKPCALNAFTFSAPRFGLFSCGFGFFFSFLFFLFFFFSFLLFFFFLSQLLGPMWDETRKGGKRTLFFFFARGSNRAEGRVRVRVAQAGRRGQSRETRVVRCPLPPRCHVVSHSARLYSSPPLGAAHNAHTRQSNFQHRSWLRAGGWGLRLGA